MRVLFAFVALVLCLTVSVSAQGTTGPNFYIVGVEGSGDTLSYLFSINGVNVPDPSFNFTVGTTYKYVLNASLPSHPFGFSLDNAATISMANFTAADQGGMTLSGSCTAGTNPLSWFTPTGSEANPCIISITPPANAVSAVYYRCSVHSAMVGTLTPVTGGSGSTTSPPTGTTTSPPTGTTTQTPTTPAPTGSSTGKNSAAIIVPSATAFIIAAISALFSA